MFQTNHVHVSLSCTYRCHVVLYCILRLLGIDWVENVYNKRIVIQNHEFCYYVGLKLPETTNWAKQKYNVFMVTPPTWNFFGEIADLTPFVICTKTKNDLVVCCFFSFRFWYSSCPIVINITNTVSILQTFSKLHPKILQFWLQQTIMFWGKRHTLNTLFSNHFLFMTNP